MKIIITEGEKDIQFLKHICKNEEIFDTKGKGNITNYENLLKKLNTKYLNPEKITDIFIICDADNNFDDTKTKIETTKSKIKEHYKKANIDSYIFPDNKSNGCFEDLIIQMLKKDNNDKRIICIENLGICMNAIDAKIDLPKLKLGTYLYSKTTGSNRNVDEVFGKIIKEKNIIEDDLFQELKTKLKNFIS